MSRFSLIIIATLVALLAATPLDPSFAASTFSQDASDFILRLGTEAIGAVGAPEKTDAEREDGFRRLFVRSFDIPAIARFALGRYWRSATPDQQQEFTQLFQSMVVRSYAAKFKQYSGQKLVVTSSREEGERRAIVSSQIMLSGASHPTRIDWRVAGFSQGPKIYDVIVEGVSMSITEQQDFGSVIERHGQGVDGLLAELRAKYEQAAPARSDASNP